VAAALAEKELERLRARRTTDLNAIPTETRTVRAGDSYWKIISKAQWVTDAVSGDISCALSGDGGSYVRVSSCVVPASAPAGTEPLTLTSIVAPQPGNGTLTALVRNASGQPVAGMPVQAIGPTAATKPANAVGCAVFNESKPAATRCGSTRPAG
jgi:hypothetical protein